MSTFKDHDVEATSPCGEVATPVPALVEEYILAPGSRFNGNGQEISEELHRLKEVYRDKTGSARLDKIIEEARSVTNPLHDQLEWDDRIGGQENRRNQLRRLIAAVRIVNPDSEGPETYKAFVNIQIGVQQSYYPIAEALSDKELRKKVLAKALKEAKAWEDRYSQYHELSEVFKAIQKVNVTV